MRGSGGLLRRSPNGSAKVTGQNLQARVSLGVALQTGRHSSRVSKSRCCASSRAKCWRGVRNNRWSDGEENNRESPTATGRMALLMRLLGGAGGDEASVLCRNTRNDRRYFCMGRRQASLGHDAAGLEDLACALLYTFAASSRHRGRWPALVPRRRA